MKIRTSVFIGLLFLSSLGAVNNAIAEDGVISKQEFTPNSYCHEKFRSMTGTSLADDQPELNPKGDVIDFYGPCDEKPTAQDQVHSQRIENQHDYVTSFYVNK